MYKTERWMLPEGIEELLPPDAARLEALRRRLLDLFDGWGYELVIPPLVEYLESLLTGTGNDLDLETFKLTDPMSGRLLGVRADMTPQAARIDAHQLKRLVPTRLCYLGTVLHTQPKGPGESRCPIQVGAELYGHAGIEADIEVLALMVATLQEVGLTNLHVDLGHVGVFRGLARRAGLDASQEAALFAALQRKASPEIKELLEEFAVGATEREMLMALIDLNGEMPVLERARELLAGAGDEVEQALSNLEAIAREAAGFPGVTFHFDLAELRGYHYHTGLVFAAFMPGLGQAVARGGRYDDIGRVFGRPRPATGFSADLTALLVQLPDTSPTLRGIFAPPKSSPALSQMIESLRAQGERVIQALPGQEGGALEMGCDRVLTMKEGAWVVVPAGQ